MLRITTVADTYEKIHSHGDLITHHLDGGIPWPEAYADQTTYYANVEGDMGLRLSNTDAGKFVNLGICPLNALRNEPAGY